LIGFIALTTASLGIVNTMVMSTLERRREIGVLKSLGADERDIRFLFLAESGMIGVIGAAVGIIFGWLISRVASMVAKMFMAKEGIPQTELFALPFWLILIALSIGIVVSLLAGFYPASRAAKIDPVTALRSD
jgi:putative ABC transport system permease protein